MRLKKWDIGRDLETIRGQITGSSQYPDGTSVETSRIMAAAYDGEIFLIKTKHSVYECDERDYIGDPEQLLIFIRTTVNDPGGTTKAIHL